VDQLIYKSLNRIVAVFNAYGFNSDSYKLDRSVRYVRTVFDTYKNPQSPKGWMKTFKFLLISFWRYHSGLEYEHDVKFMRELGLPGIILQGRADRFVKWLKRHRPLLFESFLATVLLGIKGGLPRPGKEALAEETKDWRVELFEPISQVPNWKSWTQADFKETPVIRDEPDPEIVAGINKYVRRLFGVNVVDPDEICFNPRVPSTSANYVDSRNRGGCMGTLLSDPRFKGSNKERDVVWMGSEHLKSIDGITQISVDENKRLFYDSLEIRKDFARCLAYCKRRAKREKALVTPVSLSEALKVRMITKCPPYLMFVMNSFIDPLRKWLKCRKTFRLTGEPLTESVIDQHFRYVDRPVLSGDYVGSTDNLKSWVSEAIVDVLMDTFYSSLGKEWKDLFKKSLTGFETWGEPQGEVTYLDHRGNERVDYRIPLTFVPLRQRKGQLMGSVTSFPVLCLANYVLCQMAMEHNPKEWDRESLLINGDDLAFYASPLAYQAWGELGTRMGLSPSPGKVDYRVGRVQLNSRVFIVDPGDGSIDELKEQSPQHFTCDQKGPVTDYGPGGPVSYYPRLWYKVPTLMFGMAMGELRSGTADASNVADYESAKKDFLYELNGLPLEDRLRMEKFFDRCFIPRIIKMYKDLPVDNPLRNVPFNLPVRLGGLGLPGVPSWQDLQTACFMKRRGIRLAPKMKTWILHDRLLSKVSDMDIEEPKTYLNEEPDLGPLYWQLFRQGWKYVLNKADWLEVGYVTRDAESILRLEMENCRRFMKAKRLAHNEPVNEDLLKPDPPTILKVKDVRDMNAWFLESSHKYLNDAEVGKISLSPRRQARIESCLSRQIEWSRFLKEDASK
jgi:hypothetical protein